MRAKLHAAWLEQQDTARVEALLHGVKNGFRKKRSALDDEASAAAPKRVVRACRVVLSSLPDALKVGGSGSSCEALQRHSLSKEVVQSVNVCLAVSSSKISWQCPVMQ